MKKALKENSLALCMIVRDEAELLPRCLNSVADLVDEIVIVDTGSTDATLEIAAAAGARIFHLPWPGDFSLARNHALTQAHSEWILMLDADEYLEDAARKVLSAFRLNPPPPARFWLRVCNLDTSGRIGEIYFMEKLFVNRETIRFVAPIHEFVVDIADPPTPLLPLPGLDVQHSGLLPDRIQALGKLARNRAILEAALERFPDALHSLYHLANTCKDMGETKAALTHYQRFLAAFATPPGPEHNFYALAVFETMECLARIEAVDQALALADRLESACAHHPDFWLQRGILLRRRGQLDLAAACFRRCLTIHPESLSMPFRPAATATLPLLQLLQLNRFRQLHPQADTDLKVRAAAEYHEVLLKLLAIWPAGIVQGLPHNLHLLLAEQTQEWPAETADPEALPALARQLWQTGERQQAHALLHLGMLRWHRPDFALILADLLRSANEPQKATQIELEARLFFPDP